MYNYTNLRSNTDRFALNHVDENSIDSLARKLKYPVEDILRAVSEVGYNKDDVEEYIRDRYNRS